MKTTRCSYPLWAWVVQLALLVAIVVSLASVSPHRVLADTPTNIITTVAGNGPATYGGDGMLTTDAPAQLFAVSTSTNDVYRYEVGMTGNPILETTITDPGLDSPSGLAFSPTGELFVINRSPNPTTGSVSRFLDPTGVPVPHGTITSSHFAGPHGASFRNGELFVAQRQGSTLRFLFDSEGAASFNGAITEGMIGLTPRGVVISPWGELFVSQCCTSNTISRYTFDAAGNVTFIGSITGGGMSNPHDMVFSPWGELFVGNFGNNSISRFTFDEQRNAVPNGQITYYEFNSPYGLDFSPWGELFVANNNNGRISRFTFDSSLQAIPNGSFATPTGLSSLRFAPLPPSSTDVAVVAPPDATGASGTRMTIPISVTTDVTGQDIYAWAFTLTFDPSVLQPVGIAVDGTLSEAWNTDENHAVGGEFQVTGYGTQALVGSGPLVSLVFDVVGGYATTTSLSFSKFRFNEGVPTATTTNGFFTAHALSVTGSIGYNTTNVPVSGATMTLVGSHGTQTSTSNTSGAYLFDQVIGEQVAGGTTIITPTKTGDVQGAISALDAAWIAQYEIGKRTFDTDQRHICDVSNNGACTIYDAALIARYLVGLHVPPSRTALWEFQPPSRSYPHLNTNQSEQNYTGFVFGDVTHNWGSGALALASAEASLLRSQTSLADEAVDILIGVGQTNRVPIRVGDMTGLDVLGYELTVTFDPSVLTLDDSVKSDSLSANWHVVANEYDSGTVNVVGFGTEPLTESGTLVWLNLRATGAVGTHTAVTITSLRLNEQTPMTQPDTQAQVTVETARVYLPLLTW